MCLNTNWSTRSADQLDLGPIVHFCISNQFSNILIPYFAGVNICYKSCWANFCLQSTVIKCLLNFIYWVPQLPGGGREIIFCELRKDFLFLYINLAFCYHYSFKCFFFMWMCSYTIFIQLFFCNYFVPKCKKLGAQLYLKIMISSLKYPWLPSNEMCKDPGMLIHCQHDQMCQQIIIAVNF